MSKIYLFDWGNTLMVDFPDQEGKMCNWLKIKATKGAFEALEHIAAHSKIYIATDAANSSELDIKAAFEKVNLSQFISGYFCKANLGISKGNKYFYLKIAKIINQSTSNMVMVGDSLEKDIIPAIEAGLEAVWVNSSKKSITTPLGCKQIQGLNELCT